MFVDELNIKAKAGNGGNGVVRWLRLHAMAKGGPAGGDGGRGGNVYALGVRDIGILGKYTGDPTFHAENGEDGRGNNEFGKNGEHLFIKIPIGSRITNKTTGEVIEIMKEGEQVELLHGGNGGYGNTHFKSSTDRTPQNAIPGQKTKETEFYIELRLGVDVGFIGLPNAGKSTLLNTFTNATPAIGSYPFTTLEPHLGDLFGYVLADIPGLIEGASAGKGLGHKFLRHVSRAKMLLHLVSLESESVIADYNTIRNELSTYDESLAQKEEWIVLTKSDVTTEEHIETIKEELRRHTNSPVYVISAELEEGTKILRDDLVKRLRSE